MIPILAKRAWHSIIVCVANELICLREFLVGKKRGVEAASWVKGLGSIKERTFAEGTSVGVALAVFGGENESQEIYGGPASCEAVF